MPDTPTVFVIDDDAQVRKLLRALITSAGLRVESHESAEEFLTAFDETKAGCIIADLIMPGMSGLQLQQHLAGRGCALPVIIISGYGNVPAAVQALKAGAVDFIEKPFHAQHLLDAVQAAVRRDAAARPRRAERAAAGARLASLSARERQVLTLLVAGESNKVIAARLGISANTVDNHRARIMKKTGAGNVAELVRLTMVAERDPDSPH
jgi:FixJ family two-component response regulator